jgi:CRP/FNR family cyclic AMP-dependent transcriptional regulator
MQAIAERIPDVFQTTQPKPLTQEDPLAYLPCTPISEFNTGHIIYSQSQPATRIYLVVEGKVKVSRQAGGSEVVVDVYQTDEFFGEAALAGSARRDELAVALEHTKVMSWSSKEIEDTAAARPRLAMALLQLMVRRSVDFGARIESFSVETITRRLMRALIVFANRFGHEESDGTIKMTAFTHELLSQYVGTTREIVTHHMSQFRRDGYVEYSRSGISLHRSALSDWQRPHQSTAA